MNYLLLIVLLWPVTGWAGEPLKRWKMIETDDYGTVLIISNFEACTEGTAKEKCRLTINYARVDVVNPPDCLATMEAAMRAMEPWVGTADHLDKNGHVKPSFVDTLIQLDKAKRCWKEQP